MLCDSRKIDKFAVSSQDIDDITEWQSSIDKPYREGQVRSDGCQGLYL